MPTDIVIPRLGWNMDEASFVGWLKEDGDLVQAGEPIFSLETDKAVQEVESMDAGRLRILPGGPQAGEIVTVGVKIGLLLEASESAAPETPETPGAAHAPPLLPVDLEHAASPVSSAPVTARRIDHERPASSPRARRKARELGIDLDQVSGTGRSGRIRERDVLAMASDHGRSAAAEPRPASSAPSTSRVVDPTRRRIAERLARSARETVPVTLTTSIDASNIVNLRRQFKAVAGARPDESVPVISYSDIVVKLAAVALTRHPILNSRWEGDRITLFQDVHIGLAADTEHGLVVPVIRDVPRLSLRQVADRSRELIERARRRVLTPEELQGGTFTVTNLGAYGIDAFTPVINHPECAILGMGRIIQACAGGRARSREAPRMTLSLTFDHRIVDGAPAARFLQELGGLLENPGPWLLS